MNNGKKYKEKKIENNLNENLFFEKLINLNCENKQYSSNNNNINTSKINLNQKIIKTDEAHIKDIFIYENKIYSYNEKINPKTYKNINYSVMKFLKNKNKNKKYCPEIAVSNKPIKNKVYITNLKFSKK